MISPYCEALHGQSGFHSYLTSCTTSLELHRSFFPLLSSSWVLGKFYKLVNKNHFLSFCFFLCTPPQIELFPLLAWPTKLLKFIRQHFLCRTLGLMLLNLRLLFGVRRNIRTRRQHFVTLTLPGSKSNEQTKEMSVLIGATRKSLTNSPTSLPHSW